MLVNKVRAVLFCVVPTAFKFTALWERSGGIDYFYLRIFLFYGFVEKVISVPKALTDFFVADCKIFKIERLGVSHITSYFAPLRVGSAVGKFDKVKCVVNPFLNFVKRNCLLHMRIVSGRKYRQRLCTDVLTELEVFKISESQRLIVSPVVTS